MFEPVQNQKAYVQVANQLRQHIIEGKLKTGDRLPPERVLAEAFGTSRPPIREALSALELMGLVETRTGYGTVVKSQHAEAMPISSVAGDSSPSEVMEARLVIEPEIARIASSRASTEDILAIQSTLDQMHIAHVAQDYEAFNRADAEFHLALARASHSDMLFKFAVAISVGMREGLWQALKRSVVSNMKRYASEHENIVEAIVARDSERATELARDHVKGIHNDIFE